MPSKNQSGCKCCAPSCVGHHNALVFGLTGCGLPVSGASVSFTSATHTYSGTTDGSGGVTITDPAPGTYTIAWSFSPYSATQTATITTSCNSASASDQLQAHTSFTPVCCSSCIWPIPNVFHITDALGTHALTNTGGGWGTGFTTTVTNGGGTYTLSVTYALGCDGTLSILWEYFPTGTVCAGGTSPCNPAFPVPSGTFGPVGCTFTSVSTSVAPLCEGTFSGRSGTWPSTDGSCGYANPAAGAFTIT